MRFPRCFLKQVSRAVRETGKLGEEIGPGCDIIAEGLSQGALCRNNVDSVSQAVLIAFQGGLVRYPGRRYKRG